LRKSKRDIHLVILLQLVSGCSLALLTIWNVVASRDRTLKNASIHGLNLTQALATYSEDIVRQSAMFSLGLADRLEIDGSGPAQIQRLEALVGRQRPQMPQLNSVAICDDQGRALMFSNRPDLSGVSCKGRAYFIHHRDDPSREPFIGKPIRSRATHKWIITVSRRFNEAHGKFTGVVVVALDVENFLRLFGQIDVGRGGAIGVTYTDGSMLVRYPFREQDIMGRNFLQSPIYAKYLVDQSVGTASYTSTLDGVERLYAFRKSAMLPLVTTVALGRHEVLAAWQLNALLSIGVVSSLLGLTGLIGWLLIRDINRRTEVEGELLVTQEKLLCSNQQLELLAMKDALTGLANRRCFDETLATETKRAHRDGTPLALLMIDIDYFKRFNDTHGHLVGDACLRKVAKVLEDCVRRPSDLVARYGGEEIGVILPNTDGAGAQVVAQRILERLRQQNIRHETSPFGRVSASVGIASVSGSKLDRWQGLVEAADQALYRAKAARRDRLAMACEV